MQTDHPRATLDGSRTIHGLKLRPFSLGSIDACKVMGLSLFLGDKSEQPADAPDKTTQVAAFAWLQSAPLDLVLDAVESGAWKREVARFKHGLSLDAVGDLIDEIARLTNAATAVAIKTVPKPGNEAAEKDQPPGN